MPKYFIYFFVFKVLGKLNVTITDYSLVFYFKHSIRFIFYEVTTITSDMCWNLSIHLNSQLLSTSQEDYSDRLKKPIHTIIVATFEALPITVSNNLTLTPERNRWHWDVPGKSNIGCDRWLLFAKKSITIIYGTLIEEKM